MFRSLCVCVVVMAAVKREYSCFVVFCSKGYRAAL